jgi:hypothetical protein
MNPLEDYIVRSNDFFKLTKKDSINKYNYVSIQTNILFIRFIKYILIGTIIFLTNFLLFFSNLLYISYIKTKTNLSMKILYFLIGFLSLVVVNTGSLVIIPLMILEEIFDYYV